MPSATAAAANPNFILIQSSVSGVKVRMVALH
jgi:hypothetical protein